VKVREYVLRKETKVSKLVTAVGYVICRQKQIVFFSFIFYSFKQSFFCHIYSQIDSLISIMVEMITKSLYQPLETSPVHVNSEPTSDLNNLRLRHIKVNILVEMKVIIFLFS
jgi:hypothetical protein